MRLILVEGNYLLLDEAPWPSLAGFFDLTALIRCDDAMLTARLRRRWQDHGLSEAAIIQKLEENDLPNGRLVYANSRTPDLLVTT